MVQDSTSRIYAAGQAQLAAFSPAVLEMEYTGTLPQAAVVNLSQQSCTPRPQCAVNSTTNPAPRGAYISIYATGQGYVPGAPPDGAAITSPVTAPVPLQVNINGVYLSLYNYDSSSDIPQNQWLQYSGLSSFPGLWQINVYIPHAVAVTPGKPIPLIIVTDGEPNTGARNVRDLHQREVKRARPPVLPAPARSVFFSRTAPCSRGSDRSRDCKERSSHAGGQVPRTDCRPVFLQTFYKSAITSLRLRLRMAVVRHRRRVHEAAWGRFDRLGRLRRRASGDRFP